MTKNLLYPTSYHLLKGQENIYEILVSPGDYKRTNIQIYICVSRSYTKILTFPGLSNSLFLMTGLSGFTGHPVVSKYSVPYLINVLPRNVKQVIGIRNL